MGGEPAELQIAERIDEVEPVGRQAVGGHRLQLSGHHLAGLAPERRHNLPPHRNHLGEHTAQQRLVGQQRPTVEREHRILLVDNPTAVDHRRLAQSVAVHAQRVHQDIAHQISVRRLRLLACGHTGALHTRRKQVVGQGIDDQTVDLLRHRDVERTGASHEVSQPDAALLGDDSSRHRRSEVVDHNHHVDGMLVEQTVEFGHHTTRNLIQPVAVDTQTHIGLRHLEISKQRGLKRGVVPTPCINQ